MLNRGLAKLDHDAPVFVSATDKPEVAEKLAKRGNPQVIANAIWAFARLGPAQGRVPELCTFINTPYVAEKIVKFGDSQNISNVLWGMATLRQKTPALCFLVETPAAVQKIVNQQGSSQAVGNSVWAMATMGHDAPLLCAEIEKHENAGRLATEGSAQAVSNTLWAFYKFQYECPNFIDCIRKNISKILDEGNVQNIANIVLSISSLGYFEGAICKEVGKHAQRIAEQGNTQEICNTLWGLAISGAAAGDPNNSSEGALNILWSEAMRRPLSSFHEEEWRQLEIARLFASAEGVLLRVEDGARRERMTAVSNIIIDGGSGRFEDGVATELEELGYAGFERQVSPFNDGEGGELFKIDLAWKGAGQGNVALELDGPSHFLTRPDEGLESVGRRNGRTISKARLLRQLGWSVINFSYSENIARDAMTTEERKKMWSQLLEPYGIIPELV